MTMRAVPELNASSQYSVPWTAPRILPKGVAGFRVSFGKLRKNPTKPFLVGPPREWVPLPKSVGPLLILGGNVHVESVGSTMKNPFDSDPLAATSKVCTTTVKRSLAAKVSLTAT